MTLSFGTGEQYIAVGRDTVLEAIVTVEFGAKIAVAGKILESTSTELLARIVPRKLVASVSVVVPCVSQKTLIGLAPLTTAILDDAVAVNPFLNLNKY